jgi:hypothetical protein
MEQRSTARNLNTEDLARAQEREPVKKPEAAEVHQMEARQAEQSTPPLIDGSAAENLRNRWNQIQVSFVDQPRQAVDEADGLVADTMQRLAESFSKERQGLERQWDRGDQVSTEDLRQALQKYRSFFNRLLAA